MDRRSLKIYTTTKKEGNAGRYRRPEKKYIFDDGKYTGRKTQVKKKEQGEDGG